MYYFYLPGHRRRRALSNGSCSLGGRFAGTVTPACKVHDLGYDLLRFFHSIGQDASRHTRNSIDNNLDADFRAICGTLGWFPGLGCRVATASAVALLGLNTLREGGVPKH